MRIGLVCLLAACAPDPVLSSEEQALVGCWEGQQGTETVQIRFYDDLSVEMRAGTGNWYSGTFSVTGDALTYNFGEEPPTYYIDVTPTQFSYREPPTTFVRYICPYR